MLYIISNIKLPKQEIFYIDTPRKEEIMTQVKSKQKSDVIGGGRDETAKTQSEMERRKQRKKNRGNDVTTDWEQVDSTLIVRLIATVANIKGTTTFGYTRDGGAYYINYYVNGESDKVYIRPTEDVDSAIEAEIASWLV